MDIGAVLILTVSMGVHGFSVDLTPVGNMGACDKLRESVATTYARKEEYTRKTTPNIWEAQLTYSKVKLECKPY